MGGGRVERGWRRGMPGCTLGHAHVAAPAACDMAGAPSCHRRGLPCSTHNPGPLHAPLPQTHQTPHAYTPPGPHSLACEDFGAQLDPGIRERHGLLSQLRQDAAHIGDERDDRHRESKPRKRGGCADHAHQQRHDGEDLRGDARAGHAASAGKGSAARDKPHGKPASMHPSACASLGTPQAAAAAGRRPGGKTGSCRGHAPARTGPGHSPPHPNQAAADAATHLERAAPDHVQVLGQLPPGVSVGARSMSVACAWVGWGICPGPHQPAARPLPSCRGPLGGACSAGSATFVGCRRAGRLVGSSVQGPGMESPPQTPGHSQPPSTEVPSSCAQFAGVVGLQVADASHALAGLARHRHTHALLVQHVDQPALDMRAEPENGMEVDVDQQRLQQRAGRQSQCQGQALAGRTPEVPGGEGWSAQCSAAPPRTGGPNSFAGAPLPSLP